MYTHCGYDRFYDQGLNQHCIGGGRVGCAYQLDTPVTGEGLPDVDLDVPVVDVDVVEDPFVTLFPISNRHLKLRKLRRVREAIQKNIFLGKSPKQHVFRTLKNEKSKIS